MSKATRRPKAAGKIFAVFQDESTAAPSSENICKQTTSKRTKAFQDKENAQSSTLTSKSTKKPAPFNGKALFDLASPLKPEEQASQKLGFYIDSPCKEALSLRSLNNDALPRGDPSKKLQKRERAVKTIEIDPTEMIWPSQPPPLSSPVLANVTEAYTGTNGFNFSPLSVRFSLLPVWLSS
jgi:hypothetical protein